jgi:hypothetical protein
MTESARPEAGRCGVGPHWARSWRRFLTLFKLMVAHDGRQASWRSSSGLDLVAPSDVVRSGVRPARDEEHSTPRQGLSLSALFETILPSPPVDHL